MRVSPMPILAVLSLLTLPGLAAGQEAGQPGFYGRLQIDHHRPPQLIYSRPKSIEPVAMDRAPIYLHVPAEHARNWRRNCGRYDACGERVYFVREDWYNRQYAAPPRDGGNSPPHWRRGPPGQELRQPPPPAGNGPPPGPDHPPGGDR